MKDGLLVVNAGSSSVKFALYTLDSGANPALMLRGQLSRLDSAAEFAMHDAQGRPLPSADLPLASIRSHQDAFDALLPWLAQRANGVRLLGVGHRVVHGGTRTRPQRVTPALLEGLQTLCALAPHHQPHNLAAMRAVANTMPQLPQVACYDTAFHATQPPVARRLPLPADYREAGMMRYGFHGLSYEYIVDALPAQNGGTLPRRLIVAHLGNGASACAIEDGRSVATTMGFSTLDGLLMGTRCGTLDPGALLYLMCEHGLDERELTDLLYNRSGLLAVSGISSDMRELLASREPAAQQAVEQFCYTLARGIGSLAVALGGMDGLVFTGGIGEHAAPVRQATCRRLDWLGLELNAQANEANQTLLTTATSPIKAWVLPTNEEIVIARHTASLLCR